MAGDPEESVPVKCANNNTKGTQNNYCTAAPAYCGKGFLKYKYGNYCNQIDNKCNEGREAYFIYKNKK